jgi:hypothetical protein
VSPVFSLDTRLSILHLDWGIVHSQWLLHLLDAVQMADMRISAVLYGDVDLKGRMLPEAGVVYQLASKIPHTVALVNHVGVNTNLVVIG